MRTSNVFAVLLVVAVLGCDEGAGSGSKTATTDGAIKAEETPACATAGEEGCVCEKSGACATGLACRWDKCVPADPNGGHHSGCVEVSWSVDGCDEICAEEGKSACATGCRDLLDGETRSAVFLYADMDKCLRHNPVIWYLNCPVPAALSIFDDGQYMRCCCSE